jgi:DNA invertase Pin-like site-specific DNA recombinase
VSEKTRPAVVIYAALSRKKTKNHSEDRQDEESVESQIAKVRARLERVYSDGFDLLGVFHEVGHSGSKKNRGPELEHAIAAVTDAAETRKVVELWANTSARFARGTGKRNEARAVGELFYDLRRRGVALRTVEDDEFVTNEMLVGFASAQASKYAKDLSESVKRAKRRQAERGEHLGGPMPLGYRLAEKKKVIIDPGTVGVVRRIFELAAEGVPDRAMPRTLNAEGFRTRNGRAFNRRAVQDIVLRPFYAGIVMYEGEEFDGSHPRLVDRTMWRQIVARATSATRVPARTCVAAPLRTMRWPALPYAGAAASACTPARPTTAARTAAVLAGTCATATSTPPGSATRRSTPTSSTRRSSPRWTPCSSTSPPGVSRSRIATPPSARESRARSTQRNAMREMSSGRYARSRRTTSASC